MAHKQIKIATFGCWNKGGGLSDGLNHVIDMLKTREHEYKFLTILGDNYYSNKVRVTINDGNEIKIKDIDQMQMKEGFDCVDKLHMAKKIIFGNHDIEEGTDMSCNVLKFQLKLPWYDVKYPFEAEKHFVIDDNNKYESVLMLYLDTTIYDKLIDTCYLATLGKTSKELRDEQRNFIINEIKKITDEPLNNCKQIILFGHEPLFLYKSDKKFGVREELIDIIFTEKQKYPLIRFTWVCADYHIYQNTKITHNLLEIQQLIFGTGGGELDNCPPTNNKEITTSSSKTYNLTVETNACDTRYDTMGIKNYGYGDLTIKPNGVIEHKFIPVPVIPPLTGGRIIKKYKISNK